MITLFKKPLYLPIDKKELFIYALKNPDQYTYLIFQSHWENLDQKDKRDLLKKYSQNKFSVLSELIVLNRKIKNAHVVMSYLLSSGFEFNKKDQTRLKNHAWVHLENFLSQRKQILKGKKVALIDNISGMLNKDMVKVLVNCLDKLPFELKNRVIEQSDSADLLRVYEMDI